MATSTTTTQLADGAAQLRDVHRRLLAGPGPFRAALMQARDPNVWQGTVRDAFVSWLDTADRYLRDRLAHGVDVVATSTEKQARAAEDHERAVAAGTPGTTPLPPPAPLRDPGPGTHPAYVPYQGPVKGYAGMDPDKVRTLAQQIGGAADEIYALGARLHKSIGGLTGLIPPDAAEAAGVDAFGQLSGALKDAARDLSRRAQQADTAYTAGALIGAPPRILGTAMAIAVAAVKAAGSVPATQPQPDPESARKGEEMAKKYRGKHHNALNDPKALEQLAKELGAHAGDSAFAAAFIHAFGAKNMLQLPRVLQAAQYREVIRGASVRGEHYRYDIWVDNPPKDPVALLAVFSKALASATTSGSLSAADQRAIAANGDTVALSWLVGAGEDRFGTDFLLQAFNNAVVKDIQQQAQLASGLGSAVGSRESFPLGTAVAGHKYLPLDPKIGILQAMARNPDAAAALLTKPFKSVEVSQLNRLDPSKVKVKNAPDLLLDYGTYEDKGDALGKMLAAASTGLHSAGQHSEADHLILRMGYAVTRGRSDIDAVVRGLAQVLADRHLADLHTSAGTGETQSSYGSSDHKEIGKALADGLFFTNSQLADLLVAISSDTSARRAFLPRVAAFEAGRARNGAEPGTDPGASWAMEIGAFQGLVVNAATQHKLDEHDAEVARNKELIACIDTAISLIPGSRIKDFLAKPIIDLPGKAKEAFLPPPSKEKVLADAHWLKEETEARVQALVVTALHDAGRLGSPGKVAQDMERYARLKTPEGRPVPIFFRQMPDGNTRLIPLNELNEDQRVAFNSWAASPELQRVPSVWAARVNASQGLEGRYRPRG